MMLITTSLAALFASSLLGPGAAAAAAPVTFPMPPMMVSVAVTPDISRSLVDHVLEETDAVWRGSGVTFVWRHAARQIVPYERAGETGPYVSSTLRVVIGNEPGASRGANLPLGWIRFEDARTPEQEIYVSYANTLRFLDAARDVVGLVSQMPLMQREALLGRAMGRALAHELGHYLLASKAHTPKGLMQANRTASEFFSVQRNGFQIDPAQRQVLAARLRRESLGGHSS
jgi:hypothetical protein